VCWGDGIGMGKSPSGSVLKTEVQPSDPTYYTDRSETSLSIRERTRILVLERFVHVIGLGYKYGVEGLV
jgi:hypothetical protein